jgi:acetoin utilization deacetylase AcuC-like enzyme
MKRHSRNSSIQNCRFSVIAFYNHLHAQHQGKLEMFRGELVVSLGMDTFVGDPIAGFTLQSQDYLRVGNDLAQAGLPTVFVFEGGYAVAEVGVNAVNVLQGFEQAKFQK